LAFCCGNVHTQTCMYMCSWRGIYKSKNDQSTGRGKRSLDKRVEIAVGSVTK